VPEQHSLQTQEEQDDLADLFNDPQPQQAEEGQDDLNLLFSDPEEEEETPEQQDDLADLFNDPPHPAERPSNRLGISLQTPGWVRRELLPSSKGQPRPMPPEELNPVVVHSSKRQPRVQGPLLKPSEKARQQSRGQNRDRQLREE
jgi:hypothetical protein